MFAEGDQFLAYVVQPDSTVMRAPLQLGIRLAGSVEVVEGLAEGDLVVRAGHQKLFPGAKVLAVNTHARDASAPVAAADETPGDPAAGPADSAGEESGS